MDRNIIHYIRVQIRDFRKNFIKSVSRRNFDEIHDYRVALKRIRTVINFVGSIPGGRNLKKHYRITHLKLAFKSGGILREMQINRLLLSGFEEELDTRFGHFRNHLRQNEQKAFRDLQLARKKFSATRLRAFENRLVDAVRHIPPEEFKVQINTFIERRIDQINELVRNHNVESTLHRIRKHTKSIKYLLEISGNPSMTFGNVNFQEENTKVLEDKIGDWHDLFIFRKDLEKYIRDVRIRKNVDPATMELVDSVEKRYNALFSETVAAVYDHYKITLEK